MKGIGYSIVIGSLALALTAGAQQVNDRRPERAKAQRTANVRAARPANTGAMMGAHRNVSTAPNRQRAYTAPRTNSNAMVNQNARMRAFREQNLARNQDLRARRDIAVNHERNFAQNQEFRARRDAAVNRERNFAVNRTRNFDVNREPNVAVNRARNLEVNRNRNTEEFRARNNLAINRTRNLNRTQSFAYYRGGNVRINNDFHNEAFRGPQYAVFRNYHRQWHDRGWWRSHFDRIVFVNNCWYYWNAGYWFPAWGYDPYAVYVYDGPIYAYNGLPPDQVIVDVQEQLQRDGYYDGPIDGVLGPMTREAIADFQADNGLSVTSVIDEPTLATLGIA